MHDAALQYDPDTIVVDVDELADAPSIAIGRVPTEDPVAHVIVEGARHRPTPDGSETACEVPIHSQFAVRLREQLTHVGGEMCPVCFTPFERRRATELDAEAAQAAEEDQRRRDADAEERRARRWKRPTSQGDR